MKNISKVDKSIVTLIDKNGLDVERVAFIEKKFKPFVEKVNEWSEKVFELNVTDPDQKDLMKEAREGRLILKNIRVQADKLRKELKEDSLKESKAIQDVYNVIKSLITPMEEHLLNQEMYVQIKQKEEEDRLNELRSEELEPYKEFVPFGLNLGSLPIDEYNKVLNGAKLQFDSKTKAEEEAEKLRIEQERIELLREERAMALQSYYDYMTKEERNAPFGTMSKDEYSNLEQTLIKRKKEHLEKIKKQEIENKKLLAEKEKAKKIAYAKIKAEKEKAKKLQLELEAKKKELSEKKQREEQQKKEELRLEKLKQLAPDKEKLEDLAKKIESLEFPSLENEEAIEIEKNVKTLLGKVTTYIRDKSKSM